MTTFLQREVIRIKGPYWADLTVRSSGNLGRMLSSSLTAESRRGLGQRRVARVLVQVLLWRCTRLGDLLLYPIPEIVSKLFNEGIWLKDGYD
jgi:hypothetical protein